MRQAWQITVVLAASAACTARSAPPAPAVTAAAAPALQPSRPVLLAPADVDRMMEAGWREAGVVPAPAASDAEWLRRVTLDLVGRVPTLAEVESFAADTRPGKRAQTVDRLLASPDYAEWWADLALDLYVARQLRKPGIEKQLDPRGYFVAAFRDNVRYDRMVTDMLTFSGELGLASPGVFLASHLRGGGPELLVSASARVFLGLQLSCAQCHDHPTDTRYKQDDFYALAAYFAKTRLRHDGRYFIVPKPRGAAAFKRPGAGDDIVAEPRFLGRSPPAMGGESLRDTAARAIVTSDLFAKAAVARTWAQLFGQGIVEPWDDLGGEGDSNHPRLLRRIADDFRDGGFDFKRLLRLLVLSRAYGLSSTAGTGTPPPTQGAAAPFARAAVRRLTPEQLFRSLRVATGTDQADPASEAKAEQKLRRLLREFEYTFGDDEMAEVSAFAGNIPQALLLWNGEVTNKGARARPGSTLAAILASTPDPARRLQRMFLATTSRPPTAEEAARFVPALTTPAAYEDMFFALLTSTEMLTNH